MTATALCARARSRAEAVPDPPEDPSIHRPLERARARPAGFYAEDAQRARLRVEVIDPASELWALVSALQRSATPEMDRRGVAKMTESAIAAHVTRPNADGTYAGCG